MIVSHGFSQFLNHLCFRGQGIHIPTELPCSGDLKNPGQLPFQEVTRGADDCVVWIFTISLVFISQHATICTSILYAIYEDSIIIHKVCIW